MFAFSQSESGKYFERIVIILKKAPDDKYRNYVRLFAMVFSKVFDNVKHSAKLKALQLIHILLTGISKLSNG